MKIKWGKKQTKQVKLYEKWEQIEKNYVVDPSRVRVYGLILLMNCSNILANDAV